MSNSTDTLKALTAARVAWHAANLEANRYFGQPNRGAARAARINADRTGQTYRFAQADHEQAVRREMVGATEAEIQKAALV